MCAPAARIVAMLPASICVRKAVYGRTARPGPNEISATPICRATMSTPTQIQVPKPPRLDGCSPGRFSFSGTRPHLRDAFSLTSLRSQGARSEEKQGEKRGSVQAIPEFSLYATPWLLTLRAREGPADSCPCHLCIAAAHPRLYAFS